MNILDNHIHSHFSMDSKEDMENIIKRAINLGVKHLTFTDHLEYEDNKFTLDLDKYVESIYKYKEKYKKDINLLTGIEIGYESNIKNEIEDIINKYPFDFVLCSTHSINSKKIYKDDFFKGLTQKESYNKYYQSIIDTTKEFRNFDIYGHLDYIIRYGNYGTKALYDDYKDIIDEVLKSIISIGKGIEINTSGYRYNLDNVHPSIDILKRYKELGGEILTIGSDAHKAVDICSGFDKAYEILDYLGFKYVCLFEKRKCKFIKVEKDIIHSA